ncbi:MAG TPA: hypothetical protein VK357_16720 [Rubrobacteraceae bacterium]|nr:hypothetical protein [Rubrobacteraceae bacterium]
MYRFDKYLRDDLELNPRLWPALVAPAAAKLQGGKLKVGAAKEISTQAGAYAGLIAEWRESFKQILRNYAWAARLQKQFEGMDPKPPEEDRKTLRNAAGKLVEALNELLDAKDATALKELGTTEDLKEVYKALAALGGKYNVWLVTGRPVTDGKLFRNAIRIFADSENSSEFAAEILKQPDDEESAQSIAELAGAGSFKSPSPKPHAVNVRRFSPTATAVLSVGLALLIALVATFVAQVYPVSGTPFGTTKDYFAAIAAGATGAAISSFLQSPLTSLLTRLRPGGL